MGFMGFMAFGLVHLLRIAQLILAVNVLALSGYGLVAHWYNADTLTAPPKQIDFLIFVPVFSFISVFYLEFVPRFAPKASHPYALFVVEILNTLFYFSGFIALAVFIGRLLFCRGSVCSAARADAVFAAFSWILWAASSVVGALKIFRGGFQNMKTDHQASSVMKEVPAQP
ncbi:hypothetical protein LHYA1_G006303 [Lachnellula hyalina]|uniref:MARVEL domain-containing protein n=1 Tax=Lachnellula hyalina TaxID=1316788 RepID=A0A8H8QXI1_9HELO|nr:uncharacterized protein LHYA1_G006303 [Lachnellula hyalina]TVY24578.1 hypothetical protein LHYA1_G006303 [Lachnellula hyalina]